MTLSEILQDLHALETGLREYEARYGVTSEDFYELYQQGLLDDDGFESTREFTRWASAYTMKLERARLPRTEPAFYHITALENAKRHFTLNPQS
jgi:hypothetical protein